MRSVTQFFFGGQHSFLFGKQCENHMITHFVFCTVILVSSTMVNWCISQDLKECALSLWDKGWETEEICDMLKGNCNTLFSCYLYSSSIPFPFYPFYHIINLLSVVYHSLIPLYDGLWFYSIHKYFIYNKIIPDSSQLFSTNWEWVLIPISMYLFLFIVVVLFLQ